MPSDGQRIGVVGGGLGGLAAACTLAARGHSVALFEKNDWLGGKAAQLERDGFRFDMGPTILTLPSVLERIFGEANRPLAEALDLRRLDPQWRCFYEDGTTLDLAEDVEVMADRVAEYAGRAADGEGYRRFQSTAARLHEVSERYFFWRNTGSVFDTMRNVGVGPKLIGDLLALRMGRSVAGTVRGHVSDARVAQMMDHFTQYVGSSPDASPAVLCGIAHMQSEEGVWYPMGGTRAVPEALASLAADLGVSVHLGASVDRLAVSDDRVTGLRLEGGETHEFDAVVCNEDTVLAHRNLLNGHGERFRRRRKYEPACSGVVLYLGLSERYDHLAHHNFVFSRDPDEEFAAIYEQGEPAEDPTCYVCAPSCTEPGVAPENGEALYVLVHAPYLRPHHDWSEMLPAYRDRIVQKLRSTAGLDDLEDRIVHESVLTPQDIADRYRVLDGAIYGLASHGRYFGAFKPANRSPDLGGLYFAGGSAHPGPGMPMALMSGWIAADVLDTDHRERA